MKEIKTYIILTFSGMSRNVQRKSLTPQALLTLSRIALLYTYDMTFIHEQNINVMQTFLSFAWKKGFSQRKIPDKASSRCLCWAHFYSYAPTHIMILVVILLSPLFTVLFSLPVKVARFEYLYFFTPSRSIISHSPKFTLILEYNVEIKDSIFFPSWRYVM